MRRALSRRGLILLSCPLLLSGAAVFGVACGFSESSAHSPRLPQARSEVQGVEARFLLGKSMARQGRWNEAAELLVETLAVQEHKTEALRLLAQGSMSSRDWEAARRYLVQLELAEPRDPAIPKALAFSLLQSGDALGALSAAQRGLALQPEDAELVRLMSEAAETAANQRPNPGRRNR